MVVDHYHHHHHHHQVQQSAWISLSLSLDLSLLSIRTDASKFLLVSQHWRVHELRSIEEYHLWVCPWFSSSASHVLFVLLEGFWRWEVGGHTAVVLWGACFRICSKQHVAFLCCPHLAFSTRILLASDWCIYTVVFIQSQLRRNPVFIR